MLDNFKQEDVIHHYILARDNGQKHYALRLATQRPPQSNMLDNLDNG